MSAVGCSASFGRARGSFHRCPENSCLFVCEAVTDHLPWHGTCWVWCCPVNCAVMFVDSGRMCKLIECFIKGLRRPLNVSKPVTFSAHMLAFCIRMLHVLSGPAFPRALFVVHWSLVFCLWPLGQGSPPLRILVLFIWLWNDQSRESLLLGLGGHE